MVEPDMTIGECDRVPERNKFGGDNQHDIETLSRSHVMRYIAELTEEMSRLAQKHECAELAFDLSVVAQKARQEMNDHR